MKMAKYNARNQVCINVYLNLSIFYRAISHLLDRIVSFLWFVKDQVVCFVQLSLCLLLSTEIKRMLKKFQLIGYS